MQKVIYNPKQVRTFLALLLIVAFWVTFKLTRHGSSQIRWVAWAAETAIIGVWLAFPRVFFPIFRTIMTASHRLGNLIFAALAIGVFFFILTPIALIMRSFGRNFMSSRIEPSLPSYYGDAEADYDIEKQY